jgi:putative glycosyltransferase (TIGR04372 family)
MKHYIKQLALLALFVAKHVISFPLIILLRSIALIIPIKIGSIRHERLGHLAMDTEYFYRTKQSRSPDGIYYLFFSGKPCNRQLLRMWKRKLHIIESPFLSSLVVHSKPILERTSLWIEKRPWYNSDGHQTLIKGKVTLQFKEDEEKRGQAYLKSKGLGVQDSFVCVFARDSSYLDMALPGKDWSYHNYRNADIDSYDLAVRYLLDKGQYVFRMGYIANKPVSLKHPRYIDYSTEDRDDFLDIYLVAKCKFFLGNSSGIQDLTYLFDRPTAGVNWVPFDATLIGKNCIFIPKKLKTKCGRKTVTIDQYPHLLRSIEEFDWKDKYNQDAMSKVGYRYEDNTPEEILELTKEMIGRLEGTWSPTDHEQHLLNQYFDSIPNNFQSYQIRTPVGLDFIKKNKFLWAIQ